MVVEIHLWECFVRSGEFGGGAINLKTKRVEGIRVGLTNLRTLNAEDVETLEAFGLKIDNTCVSTKKPSSDKVNDDLFVDDSPETLDEWINKINTMNKIIRIQNVILCGDNGVIHHKIYQYYSES